MHFTARKKTAQLSCLFTGDELQRMLEGEDSYGTDMVVPFIAGFVSKSLSFEGRFELTRMNVQYSDIVSKILLHQRDEIWVEAELMM